MPIALRAGVNILDYWNLTLKEITAILNNYKEVEETRAKEQTIIMYNQAHMIADFVSLRLNGKSIPSYEELFPQQQTEETSEAQKERDYKAMMLQKEQ